ncbi:MAG: phosphoenolpyruvate--protein phosphotransferase [Deltaproteobacteria bacterium]|jgi:phosphotransferase system enzyme I (PtsI)|nr:MAG: phosphoenolpyruvate--protein phosphotransferase [Deltaproteobacteria bacterium]
MEPKRKEDYVVKGIGGSPGIVIGKAQPIERDRIDIFAYRLIDQAEVPGEERRFKIAVEESKEQCLKVKDNILSQDAKEVVYIIDAQLMILEDRMLIDETIRRIREEKINAEWALEITLQKLRGAFKNIDDEYLSERKSDVDYIGERIVRNLLGKKQDSISDLKEKAIIVAHDLSPADTAQMTRDKVIGFATDIGGKTSHTAIMARALGIPAVVGLERITQEVKIGDFLIIDGNTGIVLINPTKTVLNEYLEKKRIYERLEKELFKYKDLPAQTLDGYRIKVVANIELIEEIPSVLEHGAEGIGLYRTEFLYLRRKELPSEEEQFQAYKSVVERFHSYTTIRTMDIGGDKFISHLDLAKEMNPAMGLRAIRFCLREVDIFKTQLRAILKASNYGKIKIMFPMISGVSEILQTKEILEKVKLELKNDGIPFDSNIKIGIMIEIPSAVTLADILAKEVDFFSIGTNDLIQYSLAIDRVNEHVAYLYEPLHPAVLRVIKHVVECGHNAGIKVGMCGEMAGEPLYIPILLGMGLDELSMNALSVLGVKKIIRSITYKESRELLDSIMGFSTASEIKSFVKEEMIKRFPSDFKDLRNSN